MKTPDAPYFFEDFQPRLKFSTLPDEHKKLAETWHLTEQGCPITSGFDRRTAVWHGQVLNRVGAFPVLVVSCATDTVTDEESADGSTEWYTGSLTQDDVLHHTRPFEIMADLARAKWPSRVLAFKNLEILLPLSSFEFTPPPLRLTEIVPVRTEFL